MPYIIEVYQNDKTGSVFIGYLAGKTAVNIPSIFTKDINKAYKFEKEDCPVEVDRWSIGDKSGYYKLKDIAQEKEHNIPGISNKALNLIIRKKTLWAEIKAQEQEYSRVRKQIKVFEDDCRDISFRIQKKIQESQDIADKLDAMEYEGLKDEEKEIKQIAKETVILPDGKIRGRDLIFISWIKRDGSGVEPINRDRDMSDFNDTIFTINCLSITEGTYIASEFNSYVVKLKSQEKTLFNND